MKIKRYLKILVVLAIVALITQYTAFANNETQDTSQATNATETPKEAFYFSENSYGGIDINGYIAAENPLHPNVVIPDMINGKNVTSISSSSFREKGLTGVKLPKELVFLGDMSFYKNKITSVTIPGKVGTTANGRWDKYAFANNELKTVVLEEGIVSMGVAPFVNNKITSITFPSSLKSISYQAFAGNSLMSIDIPNTITTIEGQAFYGNGILSPRIPNSVTNLETDAFELQGRRVESVLKNDTYTYRLPENVDASKITITTPNANVDTVAKTITCPKTITEIKYNYLLGSFGGNERYLSATLELLPKIEATFVDYDDSVLEKILLDINGSIRPTVKPSRSGYTFIGWDNPLDNILDSTVFKAQYKALPKVIANDMKLKINSDFNPKSNISAIDADGNAIVTDNIVVTSNLVNVKEPGTYKVTYKVTDLWGGVIIGSYNVTVENVLEDKILTDSTTGITAKGTFTEKSQLVVEVVLIKDSVLKDEAINRDVVGSFEAYIIGKHEGEITITFPINEIYNGRKIYISHQKHDKTIERFERIAVNDKVSVTVNELSPFTLTVDKQDIISPDKPNTNPIIPPTKPLSPSIKPDEKKKVKTNDNTASIEYAFVLLTISGVMIVGLTMTKKIIKRRN